MGDGAEGRQNWQEVQDVGGARTPSPRTWGSARTHPTWAVAPAAPVDTPNMFGPLVSTGRRIRAV